MRLHFEKPLGLMAAALIFMFLAFFVGIFRLMRLNALDTPALFELYPLHSIIMVFGFLGILIMTERVVGVRVIPGGKELKAPLLMVPFVVLGVFFEIAAYASQFLVLRFVGGFLLAAGCIAFIVTLRFLRGSSEGKVPFDFMILSVVALLWAALLSAFTSPVDDMGFIMMLLSFPLLFILGERIELTRVISTRSRGSYRSLFAVAAASIILFAIGSWQRFTLLSNTAFLAGSLLLLFVFLVVMALENQTLRQLVESSRPLPRYVSRHVRIAYVWVVVGLSIAVVYSFSGFRMNLYDPFIHSLALGFIGTMMLAHGPVILPGALKRRFDERKLSMLPLAVLTSATALRVGGDLLLLIFDSTLLTLILVVSGWLVLLAALLFIGLIVRGTIAHGRELQAPLPRSISDFAGVRLET